MRRRAKRFEAAVCGGVERLEERRLLTTFTVTSLADSGANTLRQAILDANANTSTSDVIAFDLNPLHPFTRTISPTSALPTISGPVTIDGTTQPSYAGVPLVQISGASAGASTDGLVVSAASTIKGLVISGFGGNGIKVTAANVNIEANYIGTGLGGTTDAGNGGSGVFVDHTNHALVGGASADLRNVISGNQIMGVYINGSGQNLIIGNYIGTNAAATAAIANGNGTAGADGYGVLITSNGASVSNGNNIGGPFAGWGNVISGNQRIGVYITGSCTANLVQGNFLGTNAAGTAALGNGESGFANGFSTGNTLGGMTPATRNIISGNGTDGVDYDSFTAGLTIQGNYIGTDVTGTSAIPNGLDGISIGGTGATIGGAAAGARNIISGNFRNGITVQGDFATENVIKGNAIGTQADGASALGNGGYGVWVTNGVPPFPYTGPALQNTIGGIAAGEGNVIAFNGDDGINVSGDGDPFSGFGRRTPAQNSIQGNSIFSNGALVPGALGIDIGPDGMTPSDALDADDGANDLQNSPILISAGGPSGTLVQGALNSAPSTTYAVDFYSSPADNPGEGKTYIGSTTATVAANGSSGIFTANFPGLAAGQFLTATATDASGNTSEFSSPIVIDVTPPVVTAAVFNYDGPPNPANSLAITFNEDVSASLTKPDLMLTNLTTGHTLTGTEYDFTYVAASNILIVYYHGTPFFQYPDGNYRATLLIAGITDAAGNPLSPSPGNSNYTFDFFSLAADANHDRTINALDFNALASNYGQTGRTFSQGNFNYDSVVDTLDFSLLATHFGQSLVPPLPSAFQDAGLAASQTLVRSLFGNRPIDDSIANLNTWLASVI